MRAETKERNSHGDRKPECSPARSILLFAQFRGGRVEIVLTLAGATRYLDDGKSMAAVAAA